ncbi:CocE/NonD family hydrolase [Streptomyces poonensis]|uniref:Peptidase S15 n=1 Tax=Streptomyces poonensis TaxID=68255 RepID=A0A918UYZ7_9ACTN|nr:CocE/NonD family hydrolase [Streptomyces poonensis]GGZ43608.1 peptidase S15 [Streptomyces poonensis]GLJ91692.1 peptidase S15 [Streptomyces poonensis]
MTPFSEAVEGLATDVHLPDGDGPFPTVLVRTPYDRARYRAEARGWARHGFAAAVQDVRGRFASPGEWHPYQNEAADGAATVRWIRRQPWSDGRIVAVGASYAAHCALVLAFDAPGGARPDAVVAAVPALGAAETAREPSGVERLLTRAGWWAAHGDRRDSDESALDKALAADPGLLTHLPLTGLPERLGRSLPSWAALWRHRERGRLVSRVAHADVPLLAVGGHHDHFTEDTVELWRAWGGPSARLLLGPWGHGLVTAPGPDAGPAHRVSLGELYVRWVRRALAGELAQGRHGAVALGGGNLWLPADAHGEPRTQRLRLLHGSAFTADPDRPVRSDDLTVPTVPTGGPPDRCVLVTPPLPRPLDVVGPVRVRLRATAHTPSADWAARLVALTPEGRAEGLAVGVVRREEPAGRETELTVELGRLARRLPAGSRLRLEIAGHHFPAHARNPHTGDDPVTADRLIPSGRAVDPRSVALRLPVLTSRPTPTDPAKEILR